MCCDSNYYSHTEFRFLNLISKVLLMKFLMSFRIKLLNHSKSVIRCDSSEVFGKNERELLSAMC